MSGHPSGELPQTAMHLRTVAVLIAWASIGVSALAQPAPSARQGAALLKTDIMGVFAHPDDETGMAATLARYALGQSAVVANVYCTRGEGGGNMVGTQSGAALGALREAELRDCLATLGVRYGYFLDQLDWAYTESVAATLEKWGKEQTLERLVRLVRSLRPEIIVTMNPAPTPGQHGHHQAAGVLATEAFTAAADPKRFPLQLTKEGLAVWQARRLFFSGGSGEVIATIPVNEPLADGRIPGQIAATALANHRSQAFGNFGNSPWLQRPQRFTLVKGFGPLSGVETNLLAGLPLQSPTIAPVEFAKRVPNTEVSLEFVPRPAFANYRRWVREHRLEHVAAQIQGDIPVVAGEANVVRLAVDNSSDRSLKGTLDLTLPAGWIAQPVSRSLTVAARANATFDVKVTPPPGRPADADLLATWSADGQRFEAKAKLHPLPRATVPRAKPAPLMDGSDRGWEKAVAIDVAATNLVQGKVTDAADSSAIIRVMHDGKAIFVDVQVRDDVVVTNIEPNDIKGHWRSDSVEICFDPAAGAEHTMGCYKIGIFPFDTTGVVRAARDADANQGPAEETAPRTRLTSIRTVDGYRVQAAIPFDEIGLKRGQRRLGFNVIVYDGDKRDAALGENINKSRIAWSPRSGVQGRPEDWGRIDLE